MKKDVYWLKRHYFINSIFNIIPIFGVTIFVSIFGEQFNFIDQKGNMTIWGKLFSILLIGATFVFNLVSKRSEWNDEVNAMHLNNIMREIIASANTISRRNSILMKSFISDYQSGKINVDLITSHKQINDIINEILTVVSHISSLNKDDMNVSLLVRFIDDDKWTCYSGLNIEDTLTLDEIINNPKSAISQLLSNKTKEVFYIDKAKAIEEGKYIPDFKDVSYGNKGSIICRRIPINHHDVVLADAVLNISTYGQEITKNDEKIISIIRDYVLTTYELRIQEGLINIMLNKMLVNKLNDYRLK